MYWLFDGMKAPERILISLMLLNSSATCIMLLVLITREFRPWLDAARILLLFTTHICSAVGYTLWYPTYVCPAAKSANMCRMFNLYILVINWVDIVLLSSTLEAWLHSWWYAVGQCSERRSRAYKKSSSSTRPTPRKSGGATYCTPRTALPLSLLRLDTRILGVAPAPSSPIPKPPPRNPYPPPQSRHSSFQSSRPHSTERSRPLSIQSSRPHSTESSRHSSIESSRHNSSQSSRSHSRSRSKPDLSPRSSSKSDLSPRSSARLSRPRHFI
ncbi:hypothetical protein EV122DRAFT_261714 [Schizophyllum commune]